MSPTTDKTTIYADALTYDFIHTGTRGRDFDFYKSLAVQGKYSKSLAAQDALQFRWPSPDLK